jgi:hypothetical protein
MRFDCEAAREHVDAWALGALDDDDRGALEAHVASCAACAALAAQAQETAGAVAVSVPLVAATAALKSRVMAGAAVLTDIGAERAGLRRWQRWALAAAAVFAAGAVAWATVLQVRVNDLRHEKASIASDAANLADLIETQHVVLDVVFQPDAQRIDMNGTEAAPAAWGRCVWSRAQAVGAFIARNLPPPEAGQTYQVWVMYEHDWLRAGELRTDGEGRGQLVMRDAWRRSDDLGAFEGFAVTLEQGAPEEHAGKVVMLSVPRD